MNILSNFYNYFYGDNENACFDVYNYDIFKVAVTKFPYSLDFYYNNQKIITCGRGDNHLCSFLENIQKNINSAIKTFSREYSETYYSHKREYSLEYRDEQLFYVEETEENSVYGEKNKCKKVETLVLEGKKLILTILTELYKCDIYIKRHNIFYKKIDLDPKDYTTFDDIVVVTNIERNMSIELKYKVKKIFI